MLLGDILEKLGRASVSKLTKPRMAGLDQPNYDMPARDPLEQADRDYAPLARMLGGIVHNTVTLPERLFTASEGLRTGQGYDPAPAVELMGSLYGANAPFVPGVGAFGAGRRLGSSDFGRLLKDTRMKEAQSATRQGPETIKWAAVRDAGGKTWEGPVHNDAIDSAMAAGAQMDPKVGWYGSMGFTTSKGRFVTRQEAAKLAEAANQVDRGYTGVNSGLDAADFRTAERPAWGQAQQMDPRFAAGLDAFLNTLKAGKP